MWWWLLLACVFVCLCIRIGPEDGNCLRVEAWQLFIVETSYLSNTACLLFAVCRHGRRRGDVSHLILLPGEFLSRPLTRILD